MILLSISITVSIINQLSHYNLPSFIYLILYITVFALIFSLMWTIISVTRTTTFHHRCQYYLHLHHLNHHYIVIISIITARVA